MRINIYDVILNDDRTPVLVKTRSTNYITADKDLMRPQSVVDMINYLFNAENLAEEYIWTIGTDIKGKPLGVFEVSHGTVCASMSSSREIFVRLCLIGAAGFFVVHNHPSGELRISKEDISLTDMLRQCGELMNCQLVDHLIIGEGYASFREYGFLNDKGEKNNE